MQVALRRLDFESDEALTTLSQEVRRCAALDTRDGVECTHVVAQTCASIESLVSRFELRSRPRSQTLYVRPTAGVYIVLAAHSSAVITVPDIAAGRAVLHVIDSVLIPSSVAVEL